MNATQIIMAVIICYFLLFHIGKYLIDLYLYKKELSLRKTGPPRACYPTLRKPIFFNIKIK